MLMNFFQWSQQTSNNLMIFCFFVFTGFSCQLIPVFQINVCFCLVELSLLLHIMLRYIILYNDILFFDQFFSFETPNKLIFRIFTFNPQSFHSILNLSINTNSLSNWKFLSCDTPQNRGMIRASLN